jgi:hypothetical protein
VNEDPSKIGIRDPHERVRIDSGQKTLSVGRIGIENDIIINSNKLTVAEIFGTLFVAAMISY